MGGIVRGAGQALMDRIDQIKLESNKREVERLERKVAEAGERVEKAFADLVESMRRHGFDEDTIERHAAALRLLLDDVENAELGDEQALAL